MLIAGFAVLAFVLFVINVELHGLTNRAAARGHVVETEAAPLETSVVGH